jgi:hypothetical protein
MLKHQVMVAILAFATLEFSEARAAFLPAIDVERPLEITPVRGGHGGHGGGFGHFGGFRHFRGFGGRHFGFAHRRAFVHPFHRRLVVRRFPRHVVAVRRFPRRVAFARRFRRGAFFVRAPIYAYGGGCARLRYRALVTGSAYWWQRYRWCRGW